MDVLEQDDCRSQAGVAQCLLPRDTCAAKLHRDFDGVIELDKGQLADVDVGGVATITTCICAIGARALRLW